MPAAQAAGQAMIGWWLALDQHDKDLSIFCAWMAIILVMAFWPRKGQGRRR